METARKAGMDHRPANADKFEFDESVAEIFPTMARAAIPQYEAFHEAHARMLRNTMCKGMKILDVGASRGQFASALLDQYGADFMRDVHMDMTDNQPGMLQRMRADFPDFNVIESDLSKPDWGKHLAHDYDVINCTYVLQFLPPAIQFERLHALLYRLRVGGIFILGHKAAPVVSHDGDNDLYEAAHEEYIEFRLRNGYTKEEIEAKTRALKGSMFPMNHEHVLAALRDQCVEVQETSRWMMFNTVMARK